MNMYGDPDADKSDVPSTTTTTPSFGSTTNRSGRKHAYCSERVNRLALDHRVNTNGGKESRSWLTSVKAREFCMNGVSGSREREAEEDVKSSAGRMEMGWAPT